MPARNSFATLNRTVRVVAFVIGVLAGIGIPVTYGLVAYDSEQDILSYRTERAALRVAEYVYVQGDTWRYSSHRIAELVAFYQDGEHQRVLDQRGSIVADFGARPAGPLIRVVAPILVRGQRVGSIEAELSAAHLVTRTIVLAVVGLLLGGAMVVCAHYIPLRALRTAMAEHRHVEEMLKAQVEETRAALLKAQEATHAKSMFLATMSHEIRTPMNAVIGLASSLLESRLDSDQRHLVNTISEAGQSLLRLLNDILDVSKLDAGKVRLETVAFSPGALVDNAVSIMAAKAAEKALTIQAVIDPDLPPALAGDQSRIKQVLLNLLSNAVKFTPAGGIQVHIRCVGRTTANATIEWSVRDTGIGIAADKIGGLFNEFHQAEASISRNYGGTGLGLAICKRLVEQMGGSIAVETSPGVGTTIRFTVTLPIADAAAIADPQPGTAKTGFAATLSRLRRPLQVLLAEDNETNQLVFSRLVQHFNMKLTIVATGRAALELAAVRIFDIVFMDMRMPEMDGIEATRAIRALGGPWSTIPIVAVTANAFPEDIEACRGAGMDGFIAKPVRKTMLLEALAEALGEHPLVRAADSPSAIARSEMREVQMPARVDAGGAQPVIEWPVFDDLVAEIGAEGVRAAFDVFVSETIARLDRMHKLSVNSDRARLKDEAHTLKGAAGTLGLRQLSDLARSLERAAWTITPADYVDSVDRLSACFRTARGLAEQAVAGAESAV